MDATVIQVWTWIKTRLANLVELSVLWSHLYRFFLSLILSGDFATRVETHTQNTGTVTWQPVSLTGPLSHQWPSLGLKLPGQLTKSLIFKSSSVGRREGGWITLTTHIYIDTHTHKLHPPHALIKEEAGRTLGHHGDTNERRQLLGAPGNDQLGCRVRRESPPGTHWGKVCCFGKEGGRGLIEGGGGEEQGVSWWCKWVQTWGENTGSGDDTSPVMITRSL